MIIGRLRSRSWQTPDGYKRSVVEIEADEIGVSLRWAVARPERTSNRDTTAEPAGHASATAPS